MGQPGDHIILAFWIQIHPVLLYDAVIFCECIAQHLGRICQGRICRELDGGELIAARIHSAYCHL